MTKSTSGRKEQLRGAQERRRKRQKARGERSVMLSLSPETFAGFRAMAEERGLTYSELVTALLNGEDASEAWEADCLSPVEAVKEAVEWVKRCYSVDEEQLDRFAALLVIQAELLE